MNNLQDLKRLKIIAYIGLFICCIPCVILILGYKQFFCDTCSDCPIPPKQEDCSKINLTPQQKKLILPSNLFKYKEMPSLNFFDGIVKKEIDNKFTIITSVDNQPQDKLYYYYNSSAKLKLEITTVGLIDSIDFKFILNILKIPIDTGFQESDIQTLSLTLNQNETNSYVFDISGALYGLYDFYVINNSSEFQSFNMRIKFYVIKDDQEALIPIGNGFYQI